MKKKFSITTIEFVSIMELIALPLFLLLYGSNPIMFWVMLIYIDFMQIYLLDIREVLSLLRTEQYYDLFKRYRVYSYGLSLCYLVIAFKSGTLCMILVMNDLLMTLCNPFLHRIFHRKKTK